MKASSSEGVASSSTPLKPTSDGMSLRESARSFGISKRDVWNAYKRVKANRGAGGIDGQSIADFDESLEKNLYKLWNRLASGCYFPPPVRLVEIPKADGRTRPLGIPTVADRIAQMVVTQFLQPILEPQFHADSYGYRLGKSAKDAVGVARKRCWEYDWVLDLDIKAFFETIDHELLIRAVKHHTTCPWVLLYVKRWLEAPTQRNDGSLIERTRGTPQGGVVSPILANLFLHYAFDLWMLRENPGVRFERYADDVICHLRTEKQAVLLKEQIAKRFVACGLELHPQKTLIAYCKDGRRKASYSQVHFTFLGFLFCPRLVKDPRSGGVFVGFAPAVSPKAALAIRQEMRSWQLSRRSDLSLEEIARKVNPAARGWINYYGSYYRSALYGLFEHLDDALVRWAMRKFKDLLRRPRRARAWVMRLKARQPRLFAHWALLPSATG